jgi:hypothetical protein
MRTYYLTEEHGLTWVVAEGIPGNHGTGQLEIFEGSFESEEEVLHDPVKRAAIERYKSREDDPLIEALSRKGDLWAICDAISDEMWRVDSDPSTWAPRLREAVEHAEAIAEAIAEAKRRQGLAA